MSKYIKKNYKKICEICGKTMVCSDPRQKVCSNECRKALRLKLFGRPHKEGMCAGTRGAITELIVSCKLMEDGYSVFRALSPSSFCDLVAVKNSDVMYLEVRTAYTCKNGNPMYSKRVSKNGGSPTHIAIYIAQKDYFELIKL